ncbi:dicarboxylate/amino acid:cation symporter [Wolbachia endosymbiont of Howardula sp.]|uniref:dicarboxylate/amino acid:cation symporter n=1 Tax=Wolbachia endosymbiont of Howardula sp. TaxID=2916816 RepID=UPI00217DCE6A|nr:dicarboxylate/amino acid:cation symporter [Wolbachia endosymbiont of Howardula sp.]UWI83059.1 dicarboxylate/amino acid:cation symporter [Wolbachia endosymbiont of Howardula sp.]
MFQLISLIIIISIVACFGHLVPVEVKILLYSISLSIKELILFIMPFIVFCLIFSSMNRLYNSAIKLIILLFLSIFLSNFISTIIAYSIGNVMIQNSYSISYVTTYDEIIIPLWSLNLKPIVSHLFVFFSGSILSIVITVILPHQSTIISNIISHYILWIMKIFLTPSILLFILGYSLKMQHDQVLLVLFKNYSLSLIIISSCTYFYIIFLYGFANSFNVKNWLISIGNMMPAWCTALGTLSSNATIPFTLEGSKKNISLSSHSIITPIISITSSFHLIGDCFFIIILSTIISSCYSLSMIHYMYFLSFFLLFKFAVAAVPSGGIIIMLPILEKYLNFSSEALSLITSLYIIFDPIITAANVLGNGAFAIIFTKFYNKVQ